MTIQLAHGIRLRSGTLFNYNAPHESEVRIDDIAAALSKVCRFAGHIPYFYSVAQHAINTSLIVSPQHAFTALMHDTAEAFTNDLPTPLKAVIPAFRELEERIESAMGARFGFQYPLPQEVRHADLQMLAIEKAYIKGDHSRWDVLDGVKYLHLLDLVNLEHEPTAKIEQNFLDRFEELRNCN